MSQHDDSNNTTIGSGNVYADLGFEEPDLEAVKATFARAIRDQIEARGITQGEFSSVSAGAMSRGSCADGSAPTLPIVSSRC